MDSLTQIVLGAAVGEVVLGKRLGNRAMLWGAIAGTIPDLDVMVGSIFMSKIDSLAFHRGISHSITFAVGFSFLMAYYVRWFYTDKEYHKIRGYRIFATVLAGIFMALVASVLGFIFYTIDSIPTMVIGAVVVLSVWVVLMRLLINKYIMKEQETIDVSYKSWYWFFFWTVFTHPLLDCFTAYGTQLFSPFSDYRVAFNNISVADPIYTLPFLTFLIIASLYLRSDRSRAYFNYAGIIISSVYMGFTVFNKLRTDHVMEQTIEQDGLDAIRYTTNPSILNNVLWSGTVETDSFFYSGLYSMYDTDQVFKLSPIPKNHGLLASAKPDDHTLKIIKWFANDYYAVLIRKDGRLQINDMRYGRFRDDDSDEGNYIFRFPLELRKDGYYELIDAEGGPPKNQEQRVFFDLWKRIKGK